MISTLFPYEILEYLTICKTSLRRENLKKENVNPAPFRSSDIRGIYPNEINEDFAENFAHSFAKHFKLNNKIATGRDSRDSSLALQNSLNSSFEKVGLNVINLGLCATELGSFASFHADVDAVIIVTASHNTPDFNGFKCVLRSGEAITYESGLKDIELAMGKGMDSLEGTLEGRAKGSIKDLELSGDYISFLSEKISKDALGNPRLALNGLHGTASTLATQITKHFDLNCEWHKQTPGALSPYGVDPSHPKHIADMRSFMNTSRFDIGIAWDGDCDRCVFFDKTGAQIPSYYMVGIFTQYFLQQFPGAAIVFDTKLYWNTEEIINELKGIAVPSKTGHAFMIQQMVKHKAVYGGELSSHHYFGEINATDSGMFAWLKALELIEHSDLSLQDLVQRQREKYKCTQEITLNIDDVDSAFACCLDKYEKQAVKSNTFDGISLEMPKGWRFSLKSSKTESVLRLNLESKKNGDILLEEGFKLTNLLSKFQSNAKPIKLVLQ